MSKPRYTAGQFDITVSITKYGFIVLNQEIPVESPDESNVLLAPSQAKQICAWIMEAANLLIEAENE